MLVTCTVEKQVTTAKVGVMEEEVQESVEDEVATQELVEDDSSQAVNEAEAEATRKAEEQEKNWRAMRQRQKEMEIALKQKDEILERFLSNQKQSEPVPEVEEELNPEEYANYMGVQKVAKKSVQPLEQKIAALEAKLAQQDQDKRINAFKSKFVDFDDVVNVETLELLEKKEPELAASIAELGDPYKMGLQSYKYIKALGLAEDVPNARRVKEIDQKIEKNKKAVQSPQAYDKRPMAQAFKSTAADNKRLYEEMMHYASQAQGL